MGALITVVTTSFGTHNLPGCVAGALPSYPATRYSHPRDRGLRFRGAVQPAHGYAASQGWTRFPGHRYEAHRIAEELDRQTDI